MHASDIDQIPRTAPHSVRETLRGLLRVPAITRATCTQKRTCRPRLLGHPAASEARWCWTVLPAELAPQYVVLTVTAGQIVCPLFDPQCECHVQSTAIPAGSYMYAAIACAAILSAAVRAQSFVQCTAGLTPLVLQSLLEQSRLLFLVLM